MKRDVLEILSLYSDKLEQICHDCGVNFNHVRNTLQEEPTSADDDVQIMLSDSGEVSFLSLNKKFEESYEKVQFSARSPRCCEDLMLSKKESIGDVSYSISLESPERAPKPVRRNRVLEKVEGVFEGVDLTNIPKDELGKVFLFFIERLRAAGVSVGDLENIVKNGTKKSRLLVTEDYRLVLVDFDNVELPLEGIHKALYIFYLSHPEGVANKELCDYEAELTKIYHEVCTRTRKNAVSHLVDPLDNSLCEKMSRIKKVIHDTLPKEIASIYCIEGPQGGKRSIPLDPDYIMWE